MNTMNTDPVLENEQDLAKRIETGSRNVESKSEAKESDVMHGAELLETPPDGSWTQALKAFNDWYKSIFGK